MKSSVLKWKKHFERGKKIILCSASKSGKPNGIIVISLGFIDGCLLIADCQMKITIENLKVNNKVCIIGSYYKIIGQAKVFKRGKYFGAAAYRTHDYKVNNAILVEFNTIIDMDKGKLCEMP